MSEYNVTSIYTGFWTDWTKGRFLGATITLSHRNGGLLQSFAATFTTFVCAQLWILVAFSIYHMRSNQAAKDGLTHQRLAVLRNFGAFAASWVFVQEVSAWRGKVKKAALRSILWTLFALGFAIAAGLASTFTAYITSRASQYRLVTSNECGYWAPSGYNSDTGYSSYLWYSVNHTLDAATYARTCYTQGADPSQCKKFMTTNITWTPTYNGSCPFEKDICLGEHMAFSMTTNPIDSLTDLGINSPPSDRLHLQKKTTCSPLSETKHTLILDDLIYYNFGPLATVGNFTKLYNVHARNSLVGYTLSTAYSYAGSGGSWVPIPALNRTDADVSIMFISPNSVYYPSRNQDPVFSANTQLANVSKAFYVSDYMVGTIACAEQYQVCNPAKAVCSPWMGATQLLFASAFDSDPTTARLWPNHGMSNRQIAINLRFGLAALWLSMYQTVNTRAAAALKVQQSLWELLQSEILPNDQWTRELGGWFEASLARLQQEVMMFATGPSKIVNGTYQYLNDKESEALCTNQFTRVTGDTMNFSVLGLGITFGVGALIIGLSFALGPLSRMFYDARPQIAYKQRAWTEDGALRAHRRGFMAEGIIDWNDEDIPVTVTGAKVKHFTAAGSFLDRLEREDYSPLSATSSEYRVSHRIPRKPVAETRVVSEELLPRTPYL